VEWLNYHHLLYFWLVAREGTVGAASKELGLAQPTVSAQIKTLEESLGERLFQRKGRNLVLTDTGRMVYRYADEIFSLGNELLDTLQGRPTGGPVRFSVGIADVVPKLVTHRLLDVAIQELDALHLVCYEGKPPDLLARLAVHELDLVLADRPIGPDVNVRAYNHRLGASGITVFAAARDAPRYRKHFPRSLDAAPFLYPTRNTVLRRSLEVWFEKLGIRPYAVAEFEDSALMKVFGESGAGVFAAPTVIEADVIRKYRVRAVGRTDEVKEEFFAISAERRIRHPAVIAITEAAREDFFSDGHEGGSRARRPARSGHPKKL